MMDIYTIKNRPDNERAIQSLIDAKSELNGGTKLGVTAAKQLIDEALEHLGYTEPEPKRYEDGWYLLNDNQYIKKVYATFTHNGQTLDTMVDEEDNDWRDYAIERGVFDPSRRFTYIKPVEEDSDG